MRPAPTAPGPLEPRDIDWVPVSKIGCYKAWQLSVDKMCLRTLVLWACTHLPGLTIYLAITFPLWLWIIAFDIKQNHNLNIYVPNQDYKITLLQ